MTDVSGLYPLQQSLVKGSYVKMLMRRVLSDRYRITQEKFINLLMNFDQSFDEGLGPKRQSHLYSVVLEFFLCYSIPEHKLEEFRKVNY